MSNEQPDDTEQTVAKSGNRRQWVLLGIMAVLGLALLYDYKVARPNVETAYEKLTSEYEAVNSKSDEVMDPERVAAVLGRSQWSSFSDGEDLVEVFAWQSGVPFRPHKLYVVYSTQVGNPIMARAEKFVFQARNQLVAASSKETDVSADDGGDGESGRGGGRGEGGGQRGGGFGGPGGGPRGGDGPRGGNGRPEAEGDSGTATGPEQMMENVIGKATQIFQSMDTDGNESLAGDELVGLVKERLADVDSSNDGEVSQAEFYNSIFQSPGGPGGELPLAPLLSLPVISPESDNATSDDSPGEEPSEGDASETGATEEAEGDADAGNGAGEENDAGEASPASEPDDSEEA